MAATSRTTPRRRSARGDGERLRGEIIAAAKELMSAAPSSDAVSMRAVAHAVGVTTPSIYLHFADKDALLDAVVIDVLTQLDEAMLAASVSAPTPLDRLREFGVAYVRFAIEHPEHYRLAMMDPGAKPDVDQVIEAGAWTHFREAVTECISAGIFAPADPVTVTLDLWATAHGLAALQVAKPFLPWGGSPEEVSRRVFATATLGHTVDDPASALEAALQSALAAAGRAADS